MKLAKYMKDKLTSKIAGYRTHAETHYLTPEPPAPTIEEFHRLILNTSEYKKTDFSKVPFKTDRLYFNDEFHHIPQAIPILQRGKIKLNEEFSLGPENSIRIRSDSIRRRNLNQYNSEFKTQYTNLEKELKSINTLKQFLDTYPEYKDFDYVKELITADKNKTPRKKTRPPERIEVNTSILATARLLGATYVA